MKIIHVNKEEYSVIYNAFEYFFKTEKLVQKLSDTDEMFGGENSHVWFVDTPSDNFEDRLDMFSGLANHDLFIANGSTDVTLYIIKHPTVANNYYGFFSGGNGGSVYIAEVINKANLKTLQTCLSYLTKQEVQKACSSG